MLTAQDLVRPALLTFDVTESPESALTRLADNEANGAYVIGTDGRLLGIVTDTSLSNAVTQRKRDLHDLVKNDYDVVSPDAVIGDFMHLAGSRVVPVTVVDADGRLTGVVPRAAILSSLSTVREKTHA